MTVFVVDDDLDHLAALADLVEAGGNAARAFSSAAEALEAARIALPTALITDLRMPGMDGFDLLNAIAAEGWDVPVLMLTGHGDVAHAVRAIRSGAEDFLEKPYDATYLLAVLDRALRARATRAELARLQEVVLRPATGILGESPPIVTLRDRLTALAPLDVDVVLTGETGTGKELAARALHAESPRRDGPYIALNCAALPEALFEHEVFGHASAAFPGAVEKPGKLEAACGGTLVLDEVEAMPLALQAKLLRALQERMVERLGENHLRPLDLRVIATSKSDLRALVQSGGFRADLFYRLAGAELALPPLRQLGGDIPLIFAHYAVQAARRHGRPEPQVGFALRGDLMRHDWPGNMRELKAAAERHALGLGPARPEDLPSGATLPERVAEFEAREIRAALERAFGARERAAQALGLPRRTLSDKMNRYGITSPQPE
jgi:two-component system, NtrC family, C4-dicarboxylate transport response regulator DctD